MIQLSSGTFTTQIENAILTHNLKENLKLAHASHYCLHTNSLLCKNVHAKLVDLKEDLVMYIIQHAYQTRLSYTTRKKLLNIFALL